MFRAEQRGTGFDTTLFHYGDIEYWFRIVQNSKMLYLADELCGFRRHSKSATSRNLSGMSEIGRREFDPRGGARVVQEIEKELSNGQQNSNR